MSPAEELAKFKAQQDVIGRRPKNVRKIWDCQLYQLRVALNLTQRDVAESIGVSAAGYHQMETCGSDVLLSTALKLSEFFGVPITEIWKKL